MLFVFAAWTWEETLTPVSATLVAALAFWLVRELRKRGKRALDRYELVEVLDQRVESLDQGLARIEAQLSSNGTARDAGTEGKGFREAFDTVATDLKGQLSNVKSEQEAIRAQQTVIMTALTNAIDRDDGRFEEHAAQIARLNVHMREHGHQDLLDEIAGLRGELQRFTSALTDDQDQMRGDIGALYAVTEGLDGRLVELERKDGS